MHMDTIETLLISLVKAGLLAYTSGGGALATSVQVSVDPEKSKEFWVNIGREVTY